MLILSLCVYHIETLSVQSTGQFIEWHANYSVSVFHQLLWYNLVQPSWGDDKLAIDHINYVT